MRAAYRSGVYFDGDLDIPLIDVRPYLEPVLDVHSSHQSFASRQRMPDLDGDASDQAIWFSERAGTNTPMLPDAFEVIDEWLANMREHPATVRSARSTRASRPRRRRSPAGPTFGRALSTTVPRGRARSFPIYSTSRIVAGGPIRGGVYKCALQPVGDAIARGLSGGWTPSAAQRARLERIFPTGVCDYTRPDQGRPAG